MEFLEKLNSIFVQKAFASSLGSKIGSEIGDKVNFQDINDQDALVTTIIEISIPLGVACAVILLVYGGYIMMSSQGNPDKLQEARSVVTNAIVGLLVILLSVSILLIISNSLGLNIYE